MHVRPQGDNHFLALRPDEDTCQRLSAAAERMRAWGMPARWVHPDDYHLTLVFLGPVDEEEASLLPAVVSELAGSFPRPALTLVGAGASGGTTVPQRVFAAVGDDAAACAGMHRDLCEVLQLAPEPRYRPHITLCRPQPTTAELPLFRDWPHLLESVGLAHWGACDVTDVVLYRSSGAGATRYEELASWPLI